MLIRILLALSILISANSYAGCLCVFKSCICLTRYMPQYSYLGNNTAMLRLKDKTTIFVDTRDNLIAMHLIQSGGWEDKDIKLVNSLLKANDRVIEVGSNYGTYLLRMANHLRKMQHKVLNPNQIYSFEANPRVFSLLQRSVHLNDLPISLFDSPVYSVSNKEISFAVDTMNVGAGRISHDQDAKHIDGSLSAVHKLKTVSLDDVMKGQDLKFNLIRMDAEGSELEILKGAKSILKASPEIIIYAEWYPHLMKVHSNVELELEQYMKEGFNFYKVFKGSLKHVTKDELLDTQDKFQNIVFTRQKLIS